VRKGFARLGSTEAVSLGALVRIVSSAGTTTLSAGSIVGVPSTVLPISGSTFGAGSSSAEFVARASLRRDGKIDMPAMDAENDPFTSAVSRTLGGSGLLGAAAIRRGGAGGVEMMAVPVSPSSRRQKIREPSRLSRMHCKTPSNHLLHLWQTRSDDTHHLPVSVGEPRM
jgi:hypothetical protein